MKEWIGPGVILGEYQIVERLTENWDEVFLARNAQGQLAALKMLNDNLVWESHSLQRFIRAMKSAPPLNHRNICPVLDAGATAGGRPFIVSELIHGRPLDSIEIGLSRSLAEKLELAIQLADAVHAAHRRGVLHLGLTPGKVLVEHGHHLKDGNWLNEYEYSLDESKVAIKFTGQVKVLDFAVLMSALGASMNRESFTLQPFTRTNTLPYCSPEWVSGEKLTPQSDIFSLGVVIYELLTGNKPFRGETAEDLRWSIFATEPPPLTNYVPELSPSINRAVLKALSKEPADRFASAGEFARALRGLAEEETENAAQRVEAEIRAAHSYAARWRDFQMEARVWLRANWRRCLAGTMLLCNIFFITAILIHSRRNAPPASTSATGPREKLALNFVTHHGQVREAVFGPDGVSLAYLIEDAGRLSLLYKAAEGPKKKGKSGEPPPEVLLLTTKAEQLAGLVFAPDGSAVYYLSTTPATPPKPAQLFRAPVTGGRAQLVLPEVASPIGFEPGRLQFAFLRQQGAETQLCVNESPIRVLATWHAPAELIRATPAWSHDGKTLAFVRRGKDGADTFEVAGLDVESGAQRTLASGAWVGIYGLRWLADNRTLLINGLARGAAARQIWRATASSGALTPLTQGLDDFCGLSLSPNNKRLLTVYTAPAESSGTSGGKLRSDAVTLSGW